MEGTAGFIKKGLNSFQLKVIAIIFMVIDHTGALFFPELIFLRILGRVSFPLFAFFISEGYNYSRSVSRYLIRLGICAVLFQIPDWFFGVHYVLNIFATLFFGLSAIALFDKLKDKGLALSWIAAAAMAAIAEYTGADYGAYGVFFMLLFYLAAGDMKKTLIGWFLLHTVYAISEMASTYISMGTPVFMHSLQLYSLLSLPFVALYNRERGRKMKVFFYVFYPAHMLILYGLDWLMHSAG